MPIINKRTHQYNIININKNVIFLFIKAEGEVNVMKNNAIKEILSLDKDLEIINVESEVLNKVKIKLVSVKSRKKKARCTECGKYSSSVHDVLKPSKILYLDNAGEKTYLLVTRRRFNCKSCKRHFTEDLGLTNKNRQISLKVQQKVLKDFMDKDKSLKRIAEDNHISVDKARAIFNEATKEFPKQVYYLPEVISFDEKSTYTNAGMYSFILNDPIHRVTLDILPSRKKEDLIKYFTKVENRRDVKVVIIDLYETYKEVVKICFPKAIIVADPFHYTKRVIKALDDVRLRLVDEYKSNKKSNEYYMFKNRLNKGLLLKSFLETKYELKKQEEQKKKEKEGRTRKKVSDKFNDFWYGIIKVKRNNKFIEITRIDRLHQTLNMDSELKKSYNLKEEFMRIINYTKYEDAKKSLKNWIKECKDSDILEIISASKTIEKWLDEIVNSFKDDKYSNGFTEANNNVIDKIISVSYGYRNFDFFRKRALVILRKSYSLEKIRKNKK